MNTYYLLGVKVQTMPEHVAKDILLTFLSSSDQHQIVTVNPEFVVAAQSNSEFLDIINQASLATIDGAGIIKALQYYGYEISLHHRLTGVRLTEILIDIAIKRNLKIQFVLYSKGLTSREGLKRKIAKHFPNLNFTVSNEKEAVEKAQYFLPDIILVGLGAPRQDLWISENMTRVPGARIAAGIGGTFDFIAETARRAPKIMRSTGLEWLWRLLRQPKRIVRIYRAIAIFPYLIIKNKPKKNESS